ncbi:hypothetical protein F5X98DRAFT_331048 [Xylaria grammica]|nr:hypothetical protein F5X98DRAFT_331048 [Xylaria grammica]
MPLKVLIIGAGVCGPAFATLLRRADPSLSAYEITIIERAPKLRETGLQIDLRSQGIPIVRKMGCEFPLHGAVIHLHTVLQKKRPGTSPRRC